MADWSLLGDGQQFFTYGVGGITNGGADLGATSNPAPGTTTIGCRGVVINSVVANTKSSWATVIDAGVLPYDASGFLFNVVFQGAGVNAMYDVGLGAGPTSIIDNIGCYAARVNQAGKSIYVPLPIPKGTQVSYRRQVHSAANIDTDVTITPIGVGFDPTPPFGRCITYGATTGTTVFTIIDPYSAPNTAQLAATKGGYTVIGTTTAPVSQMLIHFNEHTVASAFAYRWYVDIAIGAVASERVILSNIPNEVNVQSDAYGTEYLGPFPVHIPSGVAISARAAINLSAQGTIVNKNIGIGLYCFA